ncbi:MAG: DUF5058 family protein [Eubacteriales bacterium]|nr:DUF5058 family protein [Eubacteriales bacterium]
MGFYDVANHWLIYVMVTIGIVIVLGFAVLSLRKSWKRALEIGYTKQQLMNVTKSSLYFTIVPSIAIVIGLFSLAALLGIPWPWWRLSVIGSVAYELMAADMVFKSASVQVATATSTDFVLIMYVMTIGIIGGLVTSLFVAKKIQTGTLKRSVKDPRWGALGNSVFMMTIMVVFLVPVIVNLGVDLMTLITSAIITLILVFIIKKTGAKWLNNFVLAISLLLAMGSSVLWSALIK